MFINGFHCIIRIHNVLKYVYLINTMYTVPYTVYNIHICGIHIYGIQYTYMYIVRMKVGIPIGEQVRIHCYQEDRI